MNIKDPKFIKATKKLKKLQPLTPAKPQAATQAKYAFAPPAPWLPVSGNSRDA